MDILYQKELSKIQDKLDKLEKENAELKEMIEKNQKLLLMLANRPR